MNDWSVCMHIYIRLSSTLVSGTEKQTLLKGKETFNKEK